MMGHLWDHEGRKGRFRAPRFFGPVLASLLAFGVQGHAMAQSGKDLTESPYYEPQLEMAAAALIEAKEMLRDCLGAQALAVACVGETIDACGQSNAVCLRNEISAWTSLLSDHLIALRQSGVAPDRLRRAQAAWEVYIKDECALVSALWARDPLMREAEIRQCELDHVAARAIEVRAHALATEYQ